MNLFLEKETRVEVAIANQSVSQAIIHSFCLPVRMVERGWCNETNILCQLIPFQEIISYSGKMFSKSDWIRWSRRFVVGQRQRCNSNIIEKTFTSTALLLRKYDYPTEFIIINLFLRPTRNMAPPLHRHGGLYKLLSCELNADLK